MTYPYSRYQQARIAKGAPGYQIASDAIAQRGMSLDIVHVSDARWLDMRLEMMHADDVQALVEYENELGALIDRMMTWTPEERTHETRAALDELASRYTPTDLDRRARFNLFDAIRRADVRYGREHVAAFIAEFHADKAAILGVVKAAA